MLPQVVADGETESHLPRQLVALDESGVLPSGELLLELEVVVEESDHAHPRHRNHRDQDVAVVEARPEERTGEGRTENDETTHRRSPSLLLMRVRRSFPDHLMQAHAAKASHDAGADDPRQQNCADSSAGGAEGYPLKQSQKPEVRQSYEWNEQIVEHYAVAQVVRCGTRRSSCTPREALSNMIALRCNLA